MAEAIALLELASIAQGYFLCDAIVKRAPVQLLRAEAVSPGKFLILFGGDVASVEESYETAMEHSTEDLLDTLYLPYLHEQVLPAIAGQPQTEALDAIGIFECHTVSSSIVAADAAVKAADVKLLEFRVARGIGGKGYFTLTGELTEVEAALDAAIGSRDDGSRVKSVIIPNPHEDFLPVVRPAEAARFRGR